MGRLYAAEREWLNRQGNPLAKHSLSQPKMKSERQGRERMNPSRKEIMAQRRRLRILQGNGWENDCADMNPEQPAQSDNCTQELTKSPVTERFMKRYQKHLALNDARFLRNLVSSLC